MKPLQATVSLSLAPFDYSDREVAVMCASHNAEPVHVAAVKSLLSRARVPEDALRCPSVRPWDEEAAAADPVRRPINSDCSGKHGGMLSACRAQGWPLETYREADHPIQRSVLAAVLRITGLEEVRVGVDGCGVAVHEMSLAGLARIYATLSVPARWGGLAPHAGRAVTAMRAEPYMVAGRNRPETALMEVTEDIVAKGGAEGLMCAGIMGRGLGIAVKIRDGSSRAAGPAAIQALRQLGHVDDSHVERLAAFARPHVLGGGLPVGEMGAAFELSLV